MRQSKLLPRVTAPIPFIQCIYGHDDTSAAELGISAVLFYTVYGFFVIISYTCPNNMACCAINCTNRPSKSELHFFRFPLSDSDHLRLDHWTLNMKRQNWIPNKASRLCSEHFESHYFTTDSRGRTCLKDTAVPTIFSFSNGKVQQPKRRCLVSSYEVVSGIHIPAVNSNEEVAYVDNGSSANSLAANQSNVMMMEGTSKEALVAQDVVHDDIALTANVCEDVGLVSCIQHTNWCGKLVHLASGHSYTTSAHLPSSSLSDH